MFSLFLLLTYTLGVFANLPTTFIDGNGTAHTIQERTPNIGPRFISGGFYDKCKDVRFYLSKADDNDARKNGFNPYKSSPWLVAKCPDKKGKYKCTWLALSKCLLNSKGELYRGKKTTIDLNVVIGAENGYLTCHGNYGILDYCSGRPSHDPFSIKYDDPSTEKYYYE
ncbi:hypothetical protein F53441_5771 [Fusarium austroafricanum]|uniref:Cyanovirin-N domain-containing protein n=1 Tax=Fusarium austroafricanum TaxID=2364996 RepID=A0A8H4KL65_9HYPO|nr:hypothetical protein F53441_5771 [Fusarium austroafricanum]